MMESKVLLNFDHLCRLDYPGAAVDVICICRTEFEGITTVSRHVALPHLQIIFVCDGVVFDDTLVDEKEDFFFWHRSYTIDICSNRPPVYNIPRTISARLVQSQESSASERTWENSPPRSFNRQALSGRLQPVMIVGIEEWINRSTQSHL